MSPHGCTGHSADAAVDAAHPSWIAVEESGIHHPLLGNERVAIAAGQVIGLAAADGSATWAAA